MEKKTLDQIDQTIIDICKEMRTVNTDRVIALAESLGVILTARARLTTD